ncbi:MAG: hypothetical protein ACKVX9_18200 [Blastocatellia bacterium]
MKIVLAGILGGIVVFLCSSVTHLLTPIGRMGISVLPNEEPVLAAMRSGIQSPGLYFFPGLDMSRTLTPEEQQAWSEKVKTGPSGVIVYHPQNGPQMSPKMLLSELGTNILAALIGAFLLTMAGGSFGRRSLMVMLLGVFAWLSISVSHLIWYGFPTAFILAEGIDQAAGWLLAGLVMAKMIRPAV